MVSAVKKPEKKVQEVYLEKFRFLKKLNLERRTKLPE
jgi:hypothetical protein